MSALPYTQGDTSMLTITSATLSNGVTITAEQVQQDMDALVESDQVHGPGLEVLDSISGDEMHSFIVEAVHGGMDAWGPIEQDVIMAFLNDMVLYCETVRTIKSQPQL